MANTSVIICAYTMERWQDLVEAVESLHKQTAQPHEIIVVIDHNPELLQRVHAEIDSVTCVPNAHKQGLSGARNTAIELAQGDILAFMDEDAAAAPNWLELLEAGFTGPKVLGVGGGIVPNWVDVEPKWFPSEFNWVVGCTYTGLPESLAPIRNLIGCNMAFRREVFETVGGFRTGMGRIGKVPVGCEETELCIRALQHYDGGSFLYEPQAKVLHRVPGARANFKYFRSRCYAEGLSKAQVAHFVGADDGLSSERTYTFKTLPLGVLRGLGDTLFKFDISGAGRAAAIVIGLFTTTYGYAKGKLQQRLGLIDINDVSKQPALAES